MAVYTKDNQKTKLDRDGIGAYLRRSYENTPQDILNGLEAILLDGTPRYKMAVMNATDFVARKSRNLGVHPKNFAGEDAFINGIASDAPYHRLSPGDKKELSVLDTNSMQLKVDILKSVDEFLKNKGLERAHPANGKASLGETLFTSAVTVLQSASNTAAGGRRPTNEWGHPEPYFGNPAVEDAYSKMLDVKKTPDQMTQNKADRVMHAAKHSASSPKT